ncbi:MAG: hypothetical protein Fur0015_08260 [Ignavibacteriales bacterium]
MLLVFYSGIIKSQKKIIYGVDLSTLLQIEDNGGIFKEAGFPKDPFQIFKDHKINYVRLKLWHTPTESYNNLQKVLIAAQRAKSKGLKFLLDFHYSDWWADPAHQTKPAAWNGLTVKQLKDSIYNYTKFIISTLKANNTLPDMVQIGNEITCGLLWNEGKICGQNNTIQQWQNFTDFLKEAIRAVQDAKDENDSIKIMIHSDKGGDNAAAQWFYDGLKAYDVFYDIIGLSYYPWWQGTFSDLQNNLNDLAYRYGKNIIVVETAYPWTFNWSDNTVNIVGNSSQLLPGYSATVEGQKKFLIDLIDIVNNTKNGKGLGVFYWEPDWISTQTFGSPWENLSLFDFNGELLSSISAFDSVPTGVENIEKVVNEFYLNQNYPNPFNPSTIIKFGLPESQFVNISVYDVLGNKIQTLVNENLSAGTYSYNFDASSVSRRISSGIYFYTMTTGKYSITKKMMLIK